MQDTNEEKSLEELNSDKDTLLHKVNNCQNTAQAEVLVKNIIDDIGKGSFHDDYARRFQGIEERINRLIKELEEQSKCMVGTSFSSNFTILSQRKLKDDLDRILEGLVHIQNPIPEFLQLDFFILDSMTIKKSADMALLKSWISLPNTFVKCELIYRASRDGFETALFHEFCDRYSNTLTIAKSNFGRVFRRIF